MRTGGSLLLGLGLVTVILAGCIGETPTTGDGDLAPAYELVDALAALKDGEPTANMELLGRLDDGGNQEIDAWGDYLFVMKNPRMVIYDIADPADIQKVGEITLPGVKDVKVSNDGQWAFIGNDGGLGDVPALPSSKAGFYVVDISDKTNPVQKSFLKVEPRRGPHMVYYHETSDGRELVFGANADISINEFDRSTGTLKELARYGPELTDWNRDPQVVDVYYQGFAHDMFVMEDPVDNKTLMYVANWDAGLRIVDVTDPTKPTEVGKWMDYPDGHAGNLHTVSTDWIGDRRITVGSPEVGFSVVGGYHYAKGTEWTGVYVWDTTDPADIQLIGTWTHPDDRCAYAERGADEPFGTMGEGITSSHNLQFEDGRVYLAHYDCGAYVLDLSDDANLTAPQLLAYFTEDGMHTWDVIVHQGQMFLGDAKALFALHFVADTLGEDGVTSRA